MLPVMVELPVLLTLPLAGELPVILTTGAMAVATKISPDSSPERILSLLRMRTTVRQPQVL